MLRLIDGGQPASALPSYRVREEPTLATHDTRLREHLERLRRVQSVVSLSVMALRRQDAERDEDIATVLDHHAATVLSEEVCQLEDLLDQEDQGNAMRTG